MNLHGSLGIQVVAQVAYPADSLDKIDADACGFMWDLMLPTARRTPQHLSLRGLLQKLHHFCSLRRTVFQIFDL